MERFYNPINRRWAIKHNLKPWEGHKFGAKKFEKFIEWCVQLKIPRVSAFVLSTENLKRPKREVNAILNLFEKELEKLENEKASFIDKYEIKFNFLGDMKKLPPSLVRVMCRIMNKTRKYNKRVFNLMVAYGGKFELTQAFKKLAQKMMQTGVVTITPKQIEKNLLVKDEVDLILRTGGEQRISNFMPWQASYAELIVLKKFWPDITKQDLIRVLKEYSRRQRRFGN